MQGAAYGLLLTRLLRRYTKVRLAAWVAGLGAPYPRPGTGVELGGATWWPRFGRRNKQCSHRWGSPAQPPALILSSAPSGLEGEGFPVRRAFAGVDLAALYPFVHLDQMGEVD